MKKIIVTAVLSVVLMIGVFMGTTIEPKAAAQPINGLQFRTKEQVAQKYKELMPDLMKSVKYEDEPSTSSPYKAGKLSSQDLQAALDAVNLVRYIAGLPDDITLNEDYNSLTQHASVINAANNVLSHSPARPSDMDQEFYELAKEGASRSNIGVGYSNPAKSVICGYMDDSDKYNISQVGHRRWVLNPRMTQTGFGYAKDSSNWYGGYTAMYSMDLNRTCNVDYVAWPAAVMPVELYRYTPAFSISFNEDYLVNADWTTVTIHSQKENKDYMFGNNIDGVSAGKFYVDVAINPFMGMKGITIIFMPDNHTFSKDDVLTISVDGIYKGGVETTFSYVVELFSVEDVLENNKVSWNGIPEITGRANDALRLTWQKDANVSGYIIEQNISGKWERIARLANNSTITYRVEKLKPSTTYQFRMKAFNFKGSVPVYSDYKYVTGKTNPSTMTGVKIGGRAADALRINWTKNSTASGYIIEQYKDGKWMRIARIGNNTTTTYRVEKLKASTTYKFRIQAFGFEGSTPLYGSFSYVTGKTNPSAMTGVKIGGWAKDALRINWTKNGTASGYIIEQYKGGKWVRIARIGSNTTTTYRVENLNTSTTYQFRIQAFGFDGSMPLYGNYSYVTGKTY